MEKNKKKNNRRFSAVNYRGCKTRKFFRFKKRNNFK